VEQAIEKWMPRGNLWVLVRNVPAVQCDMCGETVFSQDIAERLVLIARAETAEVPTSLQTFPVYDFRATPRLANATSVVPVVMQSQPEVVFDRPAQAMPTVDRSVLAAV